MSVCITAQIQTVPLNGLIVNASVVAQVSRVTASAVIGEFLVSASAGTVPVSVVIGLKQVAAILADITGQAEDPVAQATRVDVVDDTATPVVIYRARGAPGSLDAQSVWQVWRVTVFSDDDVREEFANGSGGFVHVWDDRAGITYI